jgi:uncharacterized membrane protein SpoIIM required for sporulation/uncharacterized RDD family membrane protein YckC
MSQPGNLDFRQHLELETPEHVVLDYELAGVGSRALAALVDWSLVFVLVFVAFLGLGIAAGAIRGASRWFLAAGIVIIYGVIWGYFSLFEGLRQGQTPGKRWLGIRVIRDTGHGVTFAEAAARNLLLPIDMVGMIGIILIAIHPKAKRLGDLVAGTVVVRDRPVLGRVAAAPAPGRSDRASGSGTPQLNDGEFQLLRRFMSRAPALPADVRSRFAVQLAARFVGRYPGRPADDFAFVAQLHEDELARRSGRFGARTGTSGGRASGRSVAERLMARKGDRWREFQAIADRVTAGGLDVLAARELPDFAGRYREVAADLARARTYGADALVLAQLERLVAAGHSALYRSERQTWRRIWVFISRECPGAVVASWRYVAIAYLVFLIPAGAGFALLRDRPSLAPELIPDTMLERAEAGAARLAKGQGYVLAPSEERPVMATSIITNNVRVAFNCFAAGIVFGVGSLVVLGYNGLLLGAISGHFANVGMLGYLWTFVVGHGLLEITALCIAAAAGFLLGRAIIAPGDLPRRDALVLAGHRAMRLVGATVVLLIAAGTIEGFISSSAWSVTARLAVSGLSLVFLVLYLLNGRRSIDSDAV